MTCASCVARVERKLGKIPGVTATVNLPLESAHVQLTQDVATADLVKAVEAAGYGARLVARSDDGGAGTTAHPAHDEAAAAGHAHA
ncbi:MAG: heavy-metal-associated domain-containing protein, partial [Actinomycetota bacterium]|nr:heavy-metal-associated domain-containing protein [Actinomycetota bacterium]